MASLRNLYHVVRISPRQAYWEHAAGRERRAKLRNPEHAVFAMHVATETEQLRAQLSRADGAEGDAERLAAAADWVLRAQQATPDPGVSLGYFPLDTKGGWRASYPETTGYLITTLLAYSRAAGRDDVRTAAVAMAHWEVDVQMPSGAVQGGPIAPPDKQTPAAFNTGMVLDGWCSAFEATGEARFLDAAARAARFLAADMDEHDYFRSSGAFVSSGETKTYNCLCAWAMLRLSRLTGDATIGTAAVRAIEAVLRRQNAVGWFANNCLTLSAIPLTHTIGYTLQGVFEVGVLAERSDFVAAAETGLRAVLRRTREDGFLAGRFDAAWRPAADYVCLTGSCQLAIVAYRMGQLFGHHDLVALADRAMCYVKATQRLDASDPGMNGGIAGSFPILGDYMTAGYPNWATKYFMDAILARQSVNARRG